MTTFEFGRNWLRFASSLTERQIDDAGASVRGVLGLPSLSGLTMLDVGCGSGVFSLAARRMGAVVTSFDLDPDSVSCCRALKERFRPDDSDWVIREGSVLDPDSVEPLGAFDIVYAWGVLHHTGDLWSAMDRVVPLVQEQGHLFISIYNDQGACSERWRSVKRIYNRSPRSIRACLVVGVGVWFEARTFLAHLRHGRLIVPLARYRETDQRGMRGWNDLVDWVGGYPFEVARPEEVVEYYEARGFSTERLTSVGDGHGCNEFLFARTEVQ